MITDLEVTAEPLKDTINLKHALVSNIKFNNGTETKVIIIHDNFKLNFEEMNIGLNTALNRINSYKNNIDSINTSFGSIKNGEYKKCADFHNPKM